MPPVSCRQRRIPPGPPPRSPTSALGNAIGAIDPLGQQTTATYNQTFNELQTLTDANGNTPWITLTIRPTATC